MCFGKKKNSVRRYKTVGEALGKNPECLYIVITTLHEDDVYLGSIDSMPEELRTRSVTFGRVDNQTLILRI